MRQNNCPVCDNIINEKTNQKGEKLIERVIYGDVLMVINFSMDFLALYVTGKIMHLKLSPRRITLSAILGAIYSLVILSLNLKSLVGGIISFSLAFLLTFTAYGKQNFSVLVKNTAVFYIVNFALGGGITALCNLLNMWQNKKNLMINGSFNVVYGDIPLGLLVFLGPLCGLFSLIFGKIIKKKTAEKHCSLELFLNQEKASLDGLVDSGNLLTDPISGKPVIITPFNALRPIVPVELIPLFKTQDLSCFKNNTVCTRVRIIPASTINGKGLLYALSLDRITVNGKDVDAYVALPPNSEYSEDFPAIVPNTLI